MKQWLMLLTFDSDNLSFLACMSSYATLSNHSDVTYLVTDGPVPVVLLSVRVRLTDVKEIRQI